MMEDKDLEEYHNIGKPIKFHNKYKYIQGKQLTDPGSGTRVYDIDNYRKRWNDIFGKDKDKFNKLQQEQRDLDASYQQSKLNKKERDDKEE